MTTSVLNKKDSIYYSMQNVHDNIILITKLFARLYVYMWGFAFCIVFTCGKHLHDLIISFRGGLGPSK